MFESLTHLAAAVHISSDEAESLAVHFKWNFQHALQSVSRHGWATVRAQLWPKLALPARAPAVASGDEFECTGCLSDVPLALGRALTCGHRLCVACWTAWCQTKWKTNEQPRCPASTTCASIPSEAFIATLGLTDDRARRLVAEHRLASLFFFLFFPVLFWVPHLDNSCGIVKWHVLMDCNSMLFRTPFLSRQFSISYFKYLTRLLAYVPTRG